MKILFSLYGRSGFKQKWQRIFPEKEKLKKEMTLFMRKAYFCKINLVWETVRLNAKVGLLVCFKRHNIYVCHIFRH